jgi:hypothetical protein
VGAGGRHNLPYAASLRISKLIFSELRKAEVRTNPSRIGDALGDQF